MTVLVVLKCNKIKSIMRQEALWFVKDFSFPPLFIFTEFFNIHKCHFFLTSDSEGDWDTGKNKIRAQILWGREGKVEMHTMLKITWTHHWVMLGIGSIYLQQIKCKSKWSWLKVCLIWKKNFFHVTAYCVRQVSIQLPPVSTCTL